MSVIVIEETLQPELQYLSLSVEHSTFASIEQWVILCAISPFINQTTSGSTFHRGYSCDYCIYGFPSLAKDLVTLEEIFVAIHGPANERGMDLLPPERPLTRSCKQPAAQGLSLSLTWFPHHRGSLGHTHCKECSAMSTFLQSSL